MEVSELYIEITNLTAPVNWYDSSQERPMLPIEVGADDIIIGNFLLTLILGRIS